jgi:hypothetical protein
VRYGFNDAEVSMWFYDTAFVVSWYRVYAEVYFVRVFGALGRPNAC